MGVKRFKPTTPILRYKAVSDFSDLTKKKSPYKKLLKGISNKSGRNDQGRISIRHKGSRHKRRYRFIDFKRNKYDMKAFVLSIEYDPNRNARISLIRYIDGEKRYILSPLGLKVGMSIISTRLKNHKYKFLIGNSMPLNTMPVGTMIHNLELIPGKGGQIIRSAGNFGQLIDKSSQYCNVKLPSGEIRKFLGNCLATIGRMGNIDHENVVIGKAGKSRWLGRRPKVRGVAMNPIDHPHGGGEGKTSGGRHPVTPWGKPTKGFKTRDKKKITNKFITMRRKNKRGNKK